MHIRFQALPHHSNCVADVILRVQKKFLRQHMQHFAVFRQLHAARRFNRAPHVVALHIARPRTHRNPAAAIHSAHVHTRDANQRRFHRNSHNRFRFFHRATNRADRQIEIDDLALAPAFRFRSAERRESHAARVVIQFADQGARFRAADIQRHNVPFLLRQIRCSLVLPLPRRRLLLSRRTRMLYRGFLDVLRRFVPRRMRIRVRRCTRRRA